MKRLTNRYQDISNKVEKINISYNIQRNSLSKNFWKKCIKTVAAFAAINAQVSSLYAAKDSLYFLETIAGDGTAGNIDGVGTNAEFSAPIGIAIDQSDNLFVSDFNNNRIRKITQSFSTSTFAGNGISSVLNAPYCSVFDTLGNLYVSESGNNRISKITPNGSISTFAGSSVAGFFDATGIIAQFKDPRGITIDSLGNLYVSDAQNYRIRKITPTGIVSTFAGKGTAGLSNGAGASAQFGLLRGIVADSNRNLFAVDRSNNCIRKITPDGVVSIFAGSGMPGFSDGAGINASFNTPQGITIDSINNLYVTDLGRIRKITPNGIVSTFAGNGTSGFSDAYVLTGQFNSPIGIALNHLGTLFITDTNNNRIRTITPNYINLGVIDTFSTSADYGTESITLAGGTLKPLATGITLANSLILKSNSTLDLNGKSLTLAGSITSINGSYVLSITDSGSGGSLSYAGNTYTVGDSIILPFNLNGNNTTATEANFPLLGNIISSSGTPNITFNLTTADKTIASNILSPIKDLIKTGPNTLILSGTGNTNTGTTTIKNGTLVGNTNGKLALASTLTLGRENIFLNIQNGIDILTNSGISGQAQPWTQYTYSYTAENKTSYVKFNFRQDPNVEYLDTVSVVRQGDATNLLTNGDFETGNFTGWTLTNNTYFTFSSSANTGNYAYSDGTNGKISQLTQSFETTPGQVYVLSFAFKNTGGSPQQFTASMGRMEITTQSYYYLGAQNQEFTVLNNSVGSVIGLCASATDATARTLKLTNTTPLIIDGTIVGQGDIVFAGSNNVTLSDINTYTGGTTLNSGTLSISDALNIGSGILKLNGGLLQLLGTFGSVFALNQDIILLANSVINTGGRSLVLSGNITGDFGLSFIGGGSVQFGSGCTYAGHTLFDNTVNLVGSIPLSSSSYPLFNIDAGGKYTEQGYLSGSSAFVKDGTGELLLQNTQAVADTNHDTYTPNDYSGGTIIRNGPLTIEDNAQLSTVGTKTITFDGVNALSNKSAGTIGTPILKSGGPNLTSIPNALVFLSQGSVDTQLGSFSVTGEMSGPGDFYKVGDNELTLAGTSSGARGSTNIKGGALAVNAESLGSSAQVNVTSGSFRAKETMTSNRVVRLGGH